MIGLFGRTANPARLILWRHGRTRWNGTGRAQGSTDVPLDDVGVAQAREAAAVLAAYDPVFIWSSQLARSRETAEILAELTTCPVRVDERLREYALGAREGLTWPEFEAAYPDVVSAYPGAESEEHLPGAESTTEVLHRMVPALREATACLLPGQTGVIVSHGAALRTGILGFLGVPAALHPMLGGLDNCAWTLLECHPQYGWQLVNHNGGVDRYRSAVPAEESAAAGG